MLNLELHCDIAPRTSDSFLRLCDRAYFDGTIFHRLIQNFMMQGGDPTGTGRGGKSGFDGGHPFRDEFDSRLSHQGPGVVSMANNGKTCVCARAPPGFWISTPLSSPESLASSRRVSSGPLLLDADLGLICSTPCRGRVWQNKYSCPEVAEKLPATWARRRG